MKNNEEMLKKFPTMKSLDADKKASKTSEAAPAVAASVSAASAQLDLSKVKIDPLFEEYVDFDTFAKSDFENVSKSTVSSNSGSIFTFEKSIFSSTVAILC